MDKQEVNKQNNAVNLKEILKYNTLLNQYLIGTKFDIFEAECKRNELIQYLFNAEGFYKQAVIPFSIGELQSQPNEVQDKFSKNINKILMYYKRAYGFIPQRGQANDWDFYVVLRASIVDRTDPINMDLNQIIHQKEKGKSK